MVSGVPQHGVNDPPQSRPVLILYCRAYYLSFFRYAYQGVACNDLEGMTIRCSPNELVGGICPITSGDVYLSNSLKFDCSIKWGCILTNTPTTAYMASCAVKKRPPQA